MIHVKFPPAAYHLPCECGVKMAYECKARPEMCGVEKAPVHTPYEFLHDSYPYEGAESQRYQELLEERKPPVDLDKVCRETIEDLVKEKNKKETLRDLLGEGGWDHYKEFPDGSSEYMGKSYPKWDSNGFPKFTGWDNTEPATYHRAKESTDPSSEQVGGTHYSEMSIQPWDSMRAWMEPEEYCGYHVGTVLGYLSRHKKKGGLQDLKKSLHHLSELVRYFEDEEEYPW